MPYLWSAPRQRRFPLVGLREALACPHRCSHPGIQSGASAPHSKTSLGALRLLHWLGCCYSASRLAMAISVFVVDDHALVRNGIVQVINLEEDLHVVGEGTGSSETVDTIRRMEPQV